MEGPGHDVSAYAPLTMGEALKDPALEGARVVAGRVGLGREVADVGVLDLGELDALRPRQLVLSSAYPLRGTDLGQLFSAFRRARVCAFGVKLSGFWPEMPAELVDAANAADVPLLELPPGRFEDLVNPVLTAIAERQAERLRRSAMLHQSLTEAALRDETPAAIARVVMHALGRPVAIFNERGELLTATGPRGLWTSPELAERAVSAADPIDVQADGTSYLVAPIVAARRRYGTMCVAGLTATDSFARSAVAQATVVTAMQIVGQHGIEALHRRFERELLDDLADGRVAGAEARKRANRVGWPLRRPYLLLVARRRALPGASRLGPVAPAFISDGEFSAFMRAAAGAQVESRMFRRREGLAIVVHLEERHDALPAGRDVAARLSAAREVPWAPSELTVGASRPYRGIGDFTAAFREAALSAGGAGRMPGDVVLTWFDDLGPTRLLAAVEDRDALTRMAAEILAPVRGADAAGERDLLETLLVLLSRNMRLSDAAGDLFYHYNTVRHRLSRLREALGEDLDGPLRRATLGLALAALQLAAAGDGGSPKKSAAPAP